MNVGSVHNRLDDPSSVFLFRRSYLTAGSTSNRDNEDKGGTTKHRSRHQGSADLTEYSGPESLQLR